jgi:hypothetical protein
VDKSRYPILYRLIPISPLSMQPALAPAPHPSMQNPAQVSNPSSTRLSSDRSSRAHVHLSDGRMVMTEMHPPHGNHVCRVVASQCVSHRAASFRISRSLLETFCTDVFTIGPCGSGYVIYRFYLDAGSVYLGSDRRIGHGPARALINHPDCERWPTPFLGGAQWRVSSC